MTLFDKQSMAIVAMALGAIYQIEENYEVGMEFKGKINSCCTFLQDAIKLWPVTEDYNMHHWMHLKMERWKKESEDVNLKKEIIEYIAIPLLSIAALYETLKRKIRKGENIMENTKRCILLDPVFPVLNDLLYYIDPSGEQSSCFEQNTDLMKKLYNILEFYPPE